MVKWDGRHEVVENVGLNNAMHKVSADESHLTVNSRCGATSKVPDIIFVVRERGISVLKVCDGNCSNR